MESSDNVLTSITELLDVILWPIAAVLILAVLLLAFREPIRKFILDADKFTLRGFGAEISGEIGDRLRRVSASNAQVTPEETKPPQEHPETAVQRSAREVVIAAWLRLMTECRSILANQGLRTEANSVPQIMRGLRDRKLMDEKLYELVNEMRITRNIAAHEQDFDLSPEDLMYYETSIDFVIRVLRSRAEQ